MSCPDCGTPMWRQDPVPDDAWLPFVYRCFSCYPEPTP